MHTLPVPQQILEAVRNAYEMTRCMPSSPGATVRTAVLEPDGAVLAIHDLSGHEQVGLFQDMLRPLGFVEHGTQEDRQRLRCAVLLKLEVPPMAADQPSPWRT